MFKFLKEKLGQVVKKFSKEVEEDKEELKAEELTQEQKEIIEKEDTIAEVSEEQDSESEVIEEEKEEEVEEPVDEKPKTKEEISEELKELKEETQPRKELKEEKTQPPKEKKESKETVINKQQAAEKSDSKPEVSKQKVESNSQSTQESIEKPKPEKKPGFFGKLFGKKQESLQEEKESEVIEKEPAKIKKEEPIKEETSKEEVEDKIEKTSEVKKRVAEQQSAEPQKKKGFFDKVGETFTKIHLSDSKFEELFWDIEVTLLENNMAVEVIEKIKRDLKEELTTDKISRKNTQEIILDTLKKSLEEVLEIETIDLEEEIKKKKPYIIAVIGVNGSGKTTGIAKLANMFKEKGYSIVLAAADTFRAAAIQQLEEHANRLDIKLIKHDYNSDPAAVAYDAVKHAKAKDLDIVMIDTAGRLHSNDNLMQELRKLIKVNEPDLKLFIGESITGNDCVEQATKYNELIGIDAIMLTKADIDEKGGAAISISYVTKKPVLFIGTGQEYKDIKPFKKEDILQNIGL